MTRDEWDQAKFELDCLSCLAAAYEQEHNWENDEDPSATNELLIEVRALHAKLVSQLGQPPQT